MKLLNFDRVLCLSPHPDDVELSMLGTVLKYQDTKFDIITLSICGAKGFDDSYKDNRFDEVKDVWQDVNVNNVNIIRSNCMYFEDKTEPGWINYLETELMSKVSYDCIFIPPKEDSMFEHRFVNKFGYALIRHIPISLIEYHTASTLNAYIPNFHVDITKYFNIKKRAIQLFKSQLNKLYFTDEALIAKNTNFHYSKKGIKYVESYNIKELIT